MADQSVLSRRHLTRGAVPLSEVAAQGFGQIHKRGAVERRSIRKRGGITQIHRDAAAERSNAEPDDPSVDL